MVARSSQVYPVLALFFMAAFIALPQRASGQGLCVFCQLDDPGPPAVLRQQAFDTAEDHVMGVEGDDDGADGTVAFGHGLWQAPHDVDGGRNSLPKC